MYQYWAYGLTIESEIEFPELLPFQFETPDVTIYANKTPKALTGEGVVHRTRVSMNSREYLLKFLNIANYYAANGNTIIVEHLPEGDEKTIRLFLLSNVFAAILYQRHLIPLHASGILYKNGVILFCGESGAGKSTLVTALQQKGYTVFTDDVCVLQQNEEGKIMATPSYPTIKLWEDSFEKTGVEMVTEEKRIREQLPKYAYTFEDDFFTDKLPVKAIFSIKKDKAINALESTKLSIIKAFAEIKTNCYRPFHIDATNKNELVFKISSALLNNASVYEILRPEKENTISAIIHIIENEIQKL